MVVIRRHFDEIDADDRATFGKPGDQFQDLIVDEAAMARGPSARRDRRIEAVDIDRQVIAFPSLNTLQNGIDTKLADLADREDI